MRIGVAGCFHESNTFAPGKTELKNFRDQWAVGRDAFYQLYNETNTEMGGVIEAAENEEVDLVPLFNTRAVPSGIVSAEAMDVILARLIDEIEEAADTLDGLILILHGAMVSENYDDVETEILHRVRQKVGSKPLAIELDLHANVSNEMVQNSDIMIGFDTYPHIDMNDRAKEAFHFLVSCIRNEIQPVHYFQKPNLLMAPSVMDTNQEPMREMMEMAFAYEKDPEVLNVMVAGGFPYSDIKVAGVSITVTTDQNLDKAKEIAQEMDSWMWNHREQFRSQSVPVDVALERLKSVNVRPNILIESSDNVGGGSPGDATHVLKALMSYNQEKFLIIMSDSDAVKHAIKTGINGTFNFKVGGGTDHRYNNFPLHGEPVIVKGKVRLLSDGNYVHQGPNKTGFKDSMGRTAVIELEDCKESMVVITESRVSMKDISQTKSIGLEAKKFKIIVAKAAIAWKTAFGDIAQHVIELDTPGCSSANLKHFDYKKLLEDVLILEAQE